MATYNYGAGHTVNGDAGSAFVDSYKKSKLAQLLGQAYQAPEAQRSGLLAQMMQVDPESGMQAAKMLDPRFSRAANGGNAQQEYAEWLLSQAPADQREQVLGVLAGYKARPSGAAIQYREVTRPDGTKGWAAFDPQEAGAQFMGSGETYGSGVGAPQPQPQGMPGPGLYQTANGPMRLLSNMSPEELEAAQADMAAGGMAQDVSLPRRDVAPQQRAWTQNTSNPYGNATPNPFQSRPQEQQKYLDEQAQQRAQLDALPQRGQIEADNAGAREAATQDAQLDAMDRRNQLAAQGAGQTVVAKSRAEAAEAWPVVKSNAMLMVNTIDSLLAHPGRKVATGLSAKTSPSNFVPGQPGYDFKAKAKQIEGQAFLQAFNMLRGGGQITEVEGQKATAAIAALEQAQSETQYEKALRDVRQIAVNAMRTHTEKMKGAAQQGMPAKSASGRKVVRTGTQNGRKVVQYSDGSVDYAD